MWVAPTRPPFPRPDDPQQATFIESVSDVSVFPTDLQHGHTLEGPTFAVVYGLTGTGLQHGHAITAPVLSIAGLLSPADLQHGHTLEPGTVSVIYPLGPDELAHTHTLEDALLTWKSPLLSTDELQHGHTLEGPTFSVSFSLDSTDLRHFHKLAQSTVAVVYTVGPTGALHTHTIGSPIFSTGDLLTAAGLQHSHTIGPSTITRLLYQVAGEDLQHGHRILAATGTPHYVSSPAELLHNHRLNQALFGESGPLARIVVSVEPLYTVETSEEELYNITLDASPIVD